MFSLTAGHKHWLVDRSCRIRPNVVVILTPEYIRCLLFSPPEESWSLHGLLFTGHRINMVAAWSWLLAEFKLSGMKVCFLSDSSRLCVLAIFVINENTSRNNFFNFESSKVSVRREPSSSMWYSRSCLSFILGAAWSRCSGDWWR